MAVDEIVNELLQLKNDLNIVEDTPTGQALAISIRSVKAIEKISNLFERLNNGEIDDNKYHFCMQNILMFGKTLESKAEE